MCESIYGRLFSTTITDMVVFSFADRDMLMRFHWGMAAGHTYAHPKAPSNDPASGGPLSTSDTAPTRDRHRTGESDEPMDVDVNDLQDSGATDSDDSQYDQGDRSDEGTISSGSDEDASDGRSSGGEGDDEDAFL